MGRHASPPPAADAGRSRLLRLAERVALGLVAGAVILGVMRWAGAEWSTAVWVAVGTAVLVPVAAWVASTVPGADQRD